MTPQFEFVERPVEIVETTTLRQAERELARREAERRWDVKLVKTDDGTLECR